VRIARTSSNLLLRSLAVLSPIDQDYGVKRLQWLYDVGSADAKFNDSYYCNYLYLDVTFFDLPNAHPDWSDPDKIHK
jgi:hypothetical protein